MAALVDLAIVVLVLALTWALMSEGLWGAALMFFNILFSTVVALNFYEPLARLLTENVGDPISGFADTLCLTVLFLVTLVVLRVATDSLAPTMVRFPNLVYNLGRIGFGLAGASLAVGFMLLAFHTSPVHRKIFGFIDYGTKPPFGFGLDHRVLSLFQYTTGYPFARYGSGLNDPEFADTHVFDPQGRWLIAHEEARPYGEGRVDEIESQASSGGGGSSLYTREGTGPTAAGGTAGAAAGMAPPGGEF